MSSLFARSNPRSAVHWSVFRTFCCVASFALLCALSAGLTLALCRVRPVLLQIQHGSPALRELFTQIRPDLRVVLHANATFSVNRALPYTIQLGGALGGRALLERPRLSLKEIGRQLTSAASQNLPDWVVSGHRVASRGALKIFNDEDDEDDTDDTNVEIEQMFLGDLRVELAAAAFCEALTRSELDAAVSREHALKAVVHGGDDATAAVARAELNGLAYYSAARMADAAAAARSPDVVSHRLGALVRRLLQRHDSFVPLAEYLDDLLPGVSSAGIDEHVDDDDDDDELALTSSYVCTAASAGAAVEALSRHPLLARSRPEVLLVATYVFSTLALIDTWDLLYYCIAIGTLAAFFVMRAAWAAGLAKGRPFLGHVLRIAALTAVPFVFYFKLVQLWLPDAHSSGRSGGALSHPLALLASLRIESVTAQVIAHGIATLLICVHVYDDAAPAAVYLVVAQQPAPPVPAPVRQPLGAAAAAVAPAAAAAPEPRREGMQLADPAPPDAAEAAAALPGRATGGSSSSSDGSSSDDSDSDDYDEVQRRLLAAVSAMGGPGGFAASVAPGLSEEARAWDPAGADTAAQLAFVTALWGTPPAFGSGQPLPGAGRFAGAPPLLSDTAAPPSPAASAASALGVGGQGGELGGAAAPLAAEIALLSALADNAAQIAHYESLLAAHEEFLAGQL